MGGMHITQWCDTPEAVEIIVERFRKPTLQELWDLGCHWVPPQFAATGEVIKVIKEYFLFGKFWHLIKVDIEGAAAVGFTLVKISFIFGLLAVLLAPSAKADNCTTPAMIDGAMAVVHPSWNRTFMDGIEGRTFLDVWNHGSQRPKVDADAVAIYTRKQAALMWTFKDNCLVWIVEDEPVFMPLYFFEALNRGKERLMGTTS